MDWEFLIDTPREHALLLDCRSNDSFEQGSLKNAYGAAAMKKPFGSGPRSISRLSSFVQRVVALSQGKEGIICFDEGQGMFASKTAWLLRAAGLSDVRILALRFTDLSPEFCGPAREQISTEEDSTLGSASIDFKGMVPITYVQKNLIRVQLLDVRTPEEYMGNAPRMTNPVTGDICGRIPGSINWDWRRLYGKSGELRSRAELVQEIRHIGLIQERPTVIYDYNGARSAMAALILNGCGYRHVSVYLGSWMEWRKTNLPKQDVRFY